MTANKSPNQTQPTKVGFAEVEAISIAPKKRVFTCDKCGTEMIERNCKVTCPNCGSRFDCSDLNIYFD
jgi:Zn finger protein HypA/HybF involved in hydrogenase expression